MSKYGIPYMGSKASICDEIISRFPKADNFYDLFGGGFSITHAMLLRRNKDYNNFHFNEIRPGICELIKDAISGKYNYDRFKPEFITSERFHLEKENNAYIKMLWSFGNNGKSYIFSKEIEPYKKSMHNAIVFNDFDELAEKTIGMKKFNESYSINQRRLFLRNRLEFYRKTKIPDFLIPFLSESQKEKLSELDNVRHLQQLEQLEQLQQLEQLERLERLQQLEQLQRLNFYHKSYEEVVILPNSIVYCDPPYENTADYGNDFDHNKFLDWAASASFPVYISEYEIKDKRFTEIFNIEKISLFKNCQKDKLRKIERLYINKAAK